MEKKYIISIKKTRLKFTQKENSTSILETAINNNLILPYGCKSGACGSCSTKLVKGIVANKNGEITSEENQILLCQSFPQSGDIIIEYPEHQLKFIEEKNSSSLEIKPKEYLLQVLANKSITPMVKELSLHVPKKLEFRYLPGSHMEFINEDTKFSRQYSITDTPNNMLSLENNIIKFLIVNHKRNTGFSNFIHEKIKPGDLLKVKGPYSTFQYRLCKDSPVIAIAGGTGISPILSVVKDILKKDKNASILIYLSVRSREEILEMDTFVKLRDQYENFSFKITLTREVQSINSIFLNGRINENLQKIFKDLSLHRVLIAGSNGFVDSAVKEVTKLKAKKENIFTEKFS